MAIILCPTRGGESSYPNQDKAIALAKERGADLLFLYVLNVRFLGQFASAVLVDVEEELEEMGKFMLAMAQERAEKSGVHAQTMLRQGVFSDALKDAIVEHHITTVVLGSGVGESSFTTPDYLEELAQWLVAETGVEVITTGKGKIVQQQSR